MLKTFLKISGIIFLPFCGLGQSKTYSQNSVIRIPKSGNAKTANSTFLNNSPQAAKPVSEGLQSAPNQVNTSSDVPQNNLPIQSLNIGPSFYLPGSILSAFGNSVGYGINVESEFANIYKTLNVYGELSYMMGSNTVSSSNNFIDKNESNLIPIMAGIRYNVEGSLPIYFGLGLGYGMWNIKSTAIYTGSNGSPGGVYSTDSEKLSGFMYNFHVGFNFPKFSIQLKHQNLTVGETGGINLPINNFAISAHYRLLSK